jgi:hypothetical protein
MGKISLGAVWDDAKALGMANLELVSAIAGMFILLPNIVVDQLVTLVAESEPGTAFPELMAKLTDFMAANWHVLLLGGLVASFGTLAILVLLLRTERPTVRESLQAALVLLPGYFLASLMQSFIFSLGFLLFILPGIYAAGRLCLIAPVAAAERVSNPVGMLRRSLELTRGNGWRIIALFIVLLGIVLLVGIVVQTLLGVAITLVLPQAVADIITSILGGVFETVMAVVSALVSAALYRAVTPPAYANVFS